MRELPNVICPLCHRDRFFSHDVCEVMAEDIWGRKLYFRDGARAKLQAPPLPVSEWDLIPTNQKRPLSLGRRR